MTDTVNLNCLVIGDNSLYEDIFTVEIPLTYNIHLLRRAIWSKKPKWHGFISEILKLYKLKTPISITNKDDFNAKIAGLQLNTTYGQSALDMLNSTSSVAQSGLSQLAEQNLHVIVETPPQATDVASEIHECMLTATLPHYPVQMSKSTSTHPFGKIGRVMKNIDIPYYLAQDHELLQRMRHDLVA